MYLEQVPVEDILSISNRSYGGNGAIEVLAESMMELGLINPLTVRKVANDKYRLVAGRRRLAAAKLLGWSDVSCQIYPIGDDGEGEHFAEIALAENVNRMDMHPLDEAVTFRRLLDTGTSIKDIALKYDRSVSGIYQRARLCNLIKMARTKFRDGDMPLYAAAMLASLTEEQQQDFLEHNSGTIEAYNINAYLFFLQHQPVGLVADDKCAVCDRRTRHSDTDLFPEISHYNDVCTDSACYCRKVIALIAARIDTLFADQENDATVIVFHNAHPQLIPDGSKTINIGARTYVEVSLDKYVTSFSLEETAFVAVEVFFYGNRIEVSSRAYKKISKTEIDEAEGFVLPDSIPPEQQQAAKEVLGIQYKNSGDFERAVRQKVFEKVQRQVFTEKPAPERITRFVVESFNSRESKDRFKLCTGKKISQKFIAALSHAQQLVLLMALSINPWDLPQYDNVIAGVVADDNSLARFTGMTPEEITTLYQDTAAELVQEVLATEEEAG
ncbi:MAG: ParB/RepB/Spo0J family partition protein [Treponema sp.]|jgi:ParB/RepB/Spo0J family partition protein|nr:ParB/RepB/Spo0J family partition protein [Treponema sp.]